ncbi:transglutaminase domain-containing protein [Haliea sp. E17]|uniref:transglutaminase domain-containing protein n=1 Tax=Haliea sp. E17 TaxID=3401576 RepID=UPI003AAFD122
MWLHVSCQLNFEFEVPTSFILMLRPRSGAQQWIAREEYNISPTVPVTEFTDVYGNLCQRLVAPAGAFAISTAAEVKTPDLLDSAPGAAFVDVCNLPETVLNYLLPSRFCESDRFGSMALELTAGCLLGYDQVAAIENWLRANIEYIPGSSSVPISSIEVNARQSGVCRDLAHLGIALCRALSIPARMVVGYLHGLYPMDMHAWFEAFVGGRWYTFDATQNSEKCGYVAIGYGRDAADVALYTQFGPSAPPLQQVVSVSRL